MSIKGYKGFDKNMKCRGFQYEVGKEYETETARICESGFHFCENPLDVWRYYPITNGNRFAEVNGDGDVSKHDGDSKVACQTIKIGAELSIKSMVSAAVKFIFEKTSVSNTNSATSGDYANSATSGNSAHSATSGYCANSATSGDSAHSVTSGNSAHSSVAGKESIAAATGINSKAKGALGCWIVIAEWVDNDDKWHIKNVKSAKVDGKKVKPDTWYQLMGGKFVEAEDE